MGLMTKNVYKKTENKTRSDHKPTILLKSPDSENKFSGQNPIG